MMQEWKESDKTKPVSFENFVQGFHTDCTTEDEVAAYKIYLENNSYRHTYGKHANWEAWYKAEIHRYLTK